MRKKQAKKEYEQSHQASQFLHAVCGHPLSLHWARRSRETVIEQSLPLKERYDKVVRKGAGDSSGGTEDGTPPAGAADTGSIPGVPEGLHVLQRHWACGPQLLKPMSLESVPCNEEDHCSEKATHPNWIAASTLHNWGEPTDSDEDSKEPKIK